MQIMRNILMHEKYFTQIFCGIFFARPAHGAGIKFCDISIFVVCLLPQKLLLEIMCNNSIGYRTLTNVSFLWRFLNSFSVQLSGKFREWLGGL